tara:strand:+ start:570 stop:1091 length:522 start_codon:yes stop_codon:yes gene_type:complete
MDNEKLDLFKGIRDSQQKLDYFLLGLTSALFAYVGEKYKPEPISLSENTLELAAITLFFVSLLVGFWRINTNIKVMMGNYRVLDMESNQSSILSSFAEPDGYLQHSSGRVIHTQEAQIILSVISEQAPLVKKRMSRNVILSGWLSRLRNWSLMSGFLLMAFSKLYGAIYASGI